jgi:formyl-CoA transferase/CoA:oxalate CoA-transferase
VGDQSRLWGPPFIGDQSAYYLSVNRNKRSAEVDIIAPAGRAIMHRLLQTADVFVCNVRRVESLQKYGLDPETVRALNPRIVYASISGYGRSGPYAGRGGYDMIAQGEAGLMAASGEPDGEPMRWPVAIADMVTGLNTAIAILAALFKRERSGHGQFLDMALLDSQLALAPVLASGYFATGERPARLGNLHANIVPYQVFKARDKYFILGVGTERHWTRFCEAIDQGATLRDDPRFKTNPDRLAHRAELLPMLEAIFVKQDANYWLERIRAAEIPCGPINALDETLNDPQVRARAMVFEMEHAALGAIKMLGSPLNLSDTPVTYRLPPPLLGEHTQEVLSET